MCREYNEELIIKNKNSHLREKAINSVLSVNDDKLEEVLNIINLLDCPGFTNDDIKGIKWFLLGRLQGKLKDWF